MLGWTVFHSHKHAWKIWHHFLNIINFSLRQAERKLTPNTRSTNKTHPSNQICPSVLLLCCRPSNNNCFWLLIDISDTLCVKMNFFGWVATVFFCISVWHSLFPFIVIFKETCRFSSFYSYLLLFKVRKLYPGISDLHHTQRKWLKRLWRVK